MSSFVQSPRSRGSDSLLNQRFKRGTRCRNSPSARGVPLEQSASRIRPGRRTRLAEGRTTRRSRRPAPLTVTHSSCRMSVALSSGHDGGVQAVAPCVSELGIGRDASRVVLVVALPLLCTGTRGFGGTRIQIMSARIARSTGRWSMPGLPCPEAPPTGRSRATRERRVRRSAGVTSLPAVVSP